MAARPRGRRAADGRWRLVPTLFATNIVFEQLVGSLFRSELVMQIAARNGDYITPTIVGTGEHDYDRDLNYTRNLFRLLTPTTRRRGEQGAVPGVVGRLGAALPEAARALQPIWSTPSDKVVRFQSRCEPSQSFVPCSKTSSSTSPRSWTMSHEFGSATEFSNMCGVTLMNNRAASSPNVMGAKDGVDHRVPVDDPGRWRSTARLRLRRDLGSAGGRLRRRLRGDQLHALRAHGPPRRQAILFASPEDAAEYIGFDLEAL